MTDFRYTPDAELRVHGTGAIALLCSAYRSHENGLPELVKNSADAYSREDSIENDRVVVIITCDRSEQGSPSIACLDFVGTTSDEIETFFRHWANPEAARRGVDTQVQGGHGNGGKCYMTQMFNAYSVFHTVRDGKGSRYGVEGGETRFGYVPTPGEGKDYPVPSLEGELAQAIAPLQCEIASLPALAQAALEGARGFTIVLGVEPKGDLE